MAALRARAQAGLLRSSLWRPFFERAAHQILGVLLITCAAHYK
jgi:hypothetical protein